MRTPGFSGGEDPGTAVREATFLFMARGEGVHHFGVNLVSPGIDDVRNPAEWGETFEGTITGWDSRIESPGNDPGFTDLATDCGGGAVRNTRENTLTNTNPIL